MPTTRRSPSSPPTPPPNCESRPNAPRNHTSPEHRASSWRAPRPAYGAWHPGPLTRHFWLDRSFPHGSLSPSYKPDIPLLCRRKRPEGSLRTTTAPPPSTGISVATQVRSVYATSVVAKKNASANKAPPPTSVIFLRPVITLSSACAPITENANRSGPIHHNVLDIATATALPASIPPANVIAGSLSLCCFICLPLLSDCTEGTFPVGFCSLSTLSSG